MIYLHNNVCLQLGRIYNNHFKIASFKCFKYYFTYLSGTWDCCDGIFASLY